jgi:sRNA-binding protein
MKHTTTTIYRPTREDNENIIKMLVENYPKCFFENPRQRRPLKKNIAADVIVDKILQVSDEAIIAGIDWYMSNIGYSGFALSTTGAKRINLKGIEVGTVTQMEALKAQQELRDYHEKKNEQQANPVRVLSDMHANGRITDDGVKKLDAATIAPPRSTKTAAIAREFASLFETLTPYTLRHSSIIRSIRANVPLRLIAHDHDTSAQMIEQVYARFIPKTTDDVTRKALLVDDAGAATSNVVPLARGGNGS